jgi:uncharacterized protein (TIGR02145 family)
MRIILFLSCFFVLNLQNQAQTVMDIDGNAYDTISIGTQVWMKQNLKTTKLNNKTAITLVTDNSTWVALTTAAYCWNSNDETTYKSTYGALYNWYTVNTGKLCPSGWHVPSDGEWTILYNFLGGLNIAGGKLKEAGSDHWLSPNTGATNSSGFSGFAGGYRHEMDGSFNPNHDYGEWWSSTESNASNAYDRLLYFKDSNLRTNERGKKSGFSVRCLMDDNTTKIHNIYFEEILVYPNPASDKLNIINIISSKAIAIFYDLRGEQVLKSQIDSSPIDISTLTRGIYLIKILDNGNVAFNKLIKE